MKMYEIDMKDIGEYSVEEYLVLADNADEAWEYVIKSEQIERNRPHKIIEFKDGEVYANVY